jgi:hypothetical protein
MGRCGRSASRGGLTDDERALLLRGLYELRITHSAFEGPDEVALVGRIEDLVRKRKQGMLSRARGT